MQVDPVFQFVPVTHDSYYFINNCPTGVAGVPIVASDISGNTGLLGADHPGLYKVQDTAALAEMLSKCEQDPKFLKELESRSKLIAKQFTPAKERDAWRKVLVGLKVEKR
eukprot:607922-Pyramimonas_sp.AAC.1